MRYLFDNVNTTEIEKICAAGDAPETCIPCPVCGGRGVVASTSNATIYFAEISDLLQPQLHICGMCGAELEAVRPGKYQCPNCE